MEYLVFGGSGYLGSHLVDQLISENHEVVIFDNHSGKVRTHFTPVSRFINGDISKLGDFGKLDEFGPFDGVFHLAAKKSVPESVANPDKYFDVNEKGTVNVIEYCIRRGIRNFIFTSSAAVYGEVTESSPIDENYFVNPINPYGVSKLNAESALTKYSLNNDFKAVSLRTFNIVGASRSEYLDSVGENVLPVIARKINRNESFTVFGNTYSTADGTCVRDFVNVHDVARAHFLAMNFLQEKAVVNSHKIINVASGNGVSILELIAKTENLANNKLRWDFEMSRAGDPAVVIGNNGLAKHLLAWTPVVGIDQSIRETLALL